MLAKLADLHKLCFPQKPWNAEEFASLKRGGAEVIASDNGFIVWRTAVDEVEIITIGVHPDCRGTGIASALLMLMEKEIRNKNAPSKRGEMGQSQKAGQIKIFLEVAADNTAARALYEKHGYKQIGTRPKYYDGIDAIVMEKVL